MCYVCECFSFDTCLETSVIALYTKQGCQEDVQPRVENSYPAENSWRWQVKDRNARNKHFITGHLCIFEIRERLAHLLQLIKTKY